jgi:glycosyltransferase involved in cell wall biosynthesis
VKILLLTQWFEPEPFHKGLGFAKELKRKGHDVSVLTGFPNYPGGRLYPGYRQTLRRREIMDGISVTRVMLYPSHDRSAMRRILNYVSFALSSSFWIFWLPRPDLVYVYGPPPTAALAAVGLRLVRKVPFVFNDTDLWPDSLSATGMVASSTLLSLAQGWGNFVYRTAARVVVLSQGYKKRLVERGITADHIEVIPNWGIEDSCGDGEVAPILHSGFNIVFAGNMGPAQDLDVVLDAAGILAQSAPQAKFLMAGGGVDAATLTKRAKDEGLANVTFLGRLPPQEMPAVFAQADALLVHLRDEPVFAFTVPSKTQAYLRAGRPILMGVRGDAAAMVAAANAGVAFEPGNADALAKAVLRMIALSDAERDAMGKAGARYYRKALSCEAGTRTFMAIFEQVLAEAMTKPASSRRQGLPE